MTFFLVWTYLLENKMAALKLAYFAFFGILILAAMGILGIGRYIFFPRYNAFFNDPNQMAFWSLCVLAIILFCKDIKTQLKLVAFLCTFVIITLSASRSGLLGLFTLIFGLIFQFIVRKGKNSGIKSLVSICLLIIVFSFIGFMAINEYKESVSFLFNRLNEVDFGEQSDIRGYGRILQYPEYTILGAGQGADLRFSVTGLEIHSTWAGLLFYYGAPGILLFLYIVYSIFVRLKFPEKFIFLGPLFYSFSTYGLRTPIFWIFLGIAAATAFSSYKATNLQAK